MASAAMRPAAVAPLAARIPVGVRSYHEKVGTLFY